MKKQVNQKVSSKSKELLQLQYEERKKISKHQSSVQKQLLKQERFRTQTAKAQERSIKDINPYLFHQKSFGRKNPTEAFLTNFILHDSEEMSNSVSFEKEFKCCSSSKEDGVKGVKSLAILRFVKDPVDIFLDFLFRHRNS